MCTDSPPRLESGLNITYLMQTYIHIHKPLPWHEFSLFYSPPFFLASLQRVFFSGRHENSSYNPHKFAHLDYTHHRSAEIEKCEGVTPQPHRGQMVPRPGFMVIRFSMPLPLSPFPQHFRPSDMLTTSSRGGTGVASTSSSEVSEWSYFMVWIAAGSPTILTEIVRDFPQALQANTGILLRLGYDHILLNSFQFVVHPTLWRYKGAVQ